MAKKNPVAVLPPVVTVNGFDVNVTPMTNAEALYTQAGGTYNWGQIAISLDNPPQRIAMCLVHEVVHACIDHSALRAHPNMTPELEEQIVSALGFSLTQLIATQKDFVDFVQGAYEGRQIAVEALNFNIPVTGGMGAAPGLEPWPADLETPKKGKEKAPEKEVPPSRQGLPAKSAFKKMHKVCLKK